jgi:hypothetical protein
MDIDTFKKKFVASLLILIVAYLAIGIALS